LNLVYANWSVKAGREADLQQEIDFASRIHTPTSSPTSSGGSSSNIGLIIGIIIAILIAIILIVVFVFYCRKRDNNPTKSKERKGSKGPKNIPRDPEDPARRGEWEEKTDAEGKIYWLNNETGEFSWNPVDPARSRKSVYDRNWKSKMPKDKPKIVTGNGGTWTEVKDESNKTYWLNDDTGEFTWVHPGTPAPEVTAANPNSPEVETVSIPLPPPSPTPSRRSSYNRRSSRYDFDPEVAQPLIVSTEESPADHSHYHQAEEEIVAEPAEEEVEEEDEESSHVLRSYLPVPPPANGVHETAMAVRFDDDVYNTHESLPHFSARSRWG